MIPTDVSSESHAFLVDQWKAYIDLQKQSADLFFKSVVLYLGVVSVTAGLLFEAIPSSIDAKLLAVFACAASAQMLLGCRAAFLWAGSLNDRLAAIEAALDAKVRFPGRQLAGFVSVAALGTAAVLVASCFELWHAFRSV